MVLWKLWTAVLSFVIYPRSWFYGNFEQFYLLRYILDHGFNEPWEVYSFLDHCIHVLTETFNSFYPSKSRGGGGYYPQHLPLYSLYTPLPGYIPDHDIKRPKISLNTQFLYSLKSNITFQRIFGLKKKLNYCQLCTEVMYCYFVKSKMNKSLITLMVLKNNVYLKTRWFWIAFLDIDYWIQIITICNYHGEP